MHIRFRLGWGSMVSTVGDKADVGLVAVLAHSSEEHRDRPGFESAAVELEGPPAPYTLGEAYTVMSSASFAGDPVPVLPLDLHGIPYGRWGTVVGGALGSSVLSLARGVLEWYGKCFSVQVLMGTSNPQGGGFALGGRIAEVDDDGGLIVAFADDAYSIEDGGPSDTDLSLWYS
jgi:hypothetical protein